MPLCGIISSESLGLLPAVWAKECENLLEVTVVTGCDTQLEQQATRGHKEWLKMRTPWRWMAAGRAGHGQQPGSAAGAGLAHTPVLPPVLPHTSPKKKTTTCRRWSTIAWQILVITAGYFRWWILEKKKKAVETKHNFRTDKCQN